jgi:hypothetical protein
MCLVPSVALVLGSCLARTPRCEGSLSGVDPEGSTTSYVSRQSDIVENFGMITQTAAKT